MLSLYIMMMVMRIYWVTFELLLNSLIFFFRCWLHFIFQDVFFALNHSTAQLNRKWWLVWWCREISTIIRSCANESNICNDRSPEVIIPTKKLWLIIVALDWCHFKNESVFIIHLCMRHEKQTICERVSRIVQM